MIICIVHLCYLVLSCVIFRSFTLLTLVRRARASFFSGGKFYRVSCRLPAIQESTVLGSHPSRPRFSAIRTGLCDLSGPACEAATLGTLRIGIRNAT